ncbi:MAG: hypothetical protein L0922_07775, partial [Candidatus Mariimomonas ferrooxydans]
MMLHLSQRDDVEKVMYIEPPVNLFRLLLLPFSELKTGDGRRRWSRALMFRSERLSDKLYLNTPLFFIPSSPHYLNHHS